MSLDCISVSDAIWNFVREGTELTEEQLGHAGSCSSCASTMAEAQASVEAFGCIKPCPAVPDCRSAVMGRISAPRTRLLPAWSYACAVLLVAAIIAGAFIRPHVAQQASGQSKKPSRIASSPSPKLPAPEPKPEMRVTKLEKPQTPQHSKLRRTAFRPLKLRRHKHRTVPVNTAATTEPKPGWENPKLQVTPPAGDSHALAYVTWSIASQPEGSYHDSYTLTDSETGEVTKCSVKRDGKAIEINMESEPAKPETKPVKESKSNETIRCS